MTKADFERTRELLRGRGFTVEGAAYDQAHFGRWWVSVAHQPPLWIVWDGKDGWVIVQRETGERFQGRPVWEDVWIGRDRETQTVELVVSKVQELSSS
jgi:hypothetical protein